MSKSFLNSMLPSYTQFQPFTSSALNSVASLINFNNNNNNNNNTIHNNINSHNNNLRNGGINLSLATSTASDSSSLANSEDGYSKSPSVTDPSSTATQHQPHKMYPYVSNHPTSHAGLSGMPGFSGLEDKSCR